MIMLFKEPILIALYVLAIFLIPCIIFLKYGYVFAFGFITTILIFVVFSFLKETTFLEFSVEFLVLSFVFLILILFKRRVKKHDI